MFKRYLTFTVAVWFLAVGIMLNVFYIAYLAFYPFKTVSFKTQPFPVLNQQPIKPSSVLEYEVDYCRYTQAPSKLTRTLTGPSLITLVADTATGEPGCRKTKVNNVIIPTYALHGTYYLKINVCYQVNPLRNICKQVRTQDFKVE